MMFSAVIMMFSAAILMLELVTTVNCDCYKKTSFSNLPNDTLVKCSDNDLIRGIVNEEITHFDTPVVASGQECCSPPRQWSTMDKLVKHVNMSTLMGPGQWDTCPYGYFLNGFFLSRFWTKYKEDFSNLIGGQCVRPAGHPLHYEHCYEETIYDCLANNVTCSCREGYYLTGLYRSTWQGATVLDILECCSLALSPTKVVTFEELKTQIMEETLANMAFLANALGFAHCHGIRGSKCGEDFIRVGDTWQASSMTSEKDKDCSELKCDERLQIVYSDWGLEAIDISYGQISFEKLQPQTKLSSKVKNTASARMTVRLDLTEYDTVTHTVGKSYSTSPDLAFDFDVDIPLPNRDTLRYTAKVQLTGTAKSHTSILSWTNSTRVTLLRVDPNSSARYKMIVNRNKTTVPYTAVIAAKFSAEFRGYLRWKQNRSSLDAGYANYHFSHKKTEKPVYVTYRIGNESVPFQAALKREMKLDLNPWMWWGMISELTTVGRDAINALLTYRHDFKINGTLDVISKSVTETGETLNRPDASGDCWSL